MPYVITWVGSYCWRWHYRVVEQILLLSDCRQILWSKSSRCFGWGLGTRLNCHQINSHEINLPPDQLTWDQLATRSTLTRSTCHQINSHEINFVVLIACSLYKKNWVDLVRVDLVASWFHDSWSGGNWFCENWSRERSLMPNCLICLCSKYNSYLLSIGDKWVK